MQELAAGWAVGVERGPDWLFVRLYDPSTYPSEGNQLADELWALMECHFTHRIILELDQISVLRSHLIGQLVLLHKRVHTHGGLMRICGLAPQCLQALRMCGVDTRLPHYASREQAVMGGDRPRQPR